MSKQSIQIIFSGLIIIIMFTFIKNMFRENNNEALQTFIRNNAFLVDVRTPREFAEGNVPGSVNIPLDQVQNQLKRFKSHENIVVFCRSGNRSSQAVSVLKQSGFTNVINGGSWQQVKAVQDETGK